MTDEEIDVLLVRLEESLCSRIFAFPKISWLASVASLPFVFLAEARIGFGIFSGIMALVALQSTQDGRSEWQSVRQKRALFLWREWIQRETFKEGENGFEKTLEMRADILEIYENDPRGDVFPLKQAIRLVNTFNSQQEGLDTIGGHLDGLRELRAQLLEKSAQLQRLGEKNPSAPATLAQINSDIVPLETLSRQIEASCHRLEVLLISVKKALQIKQLRSEIDVLTASASNEIDTLDATDEAADASDIERQITREVETFLQLERETDRHMREI